MRADPSSDRSPTQQALLARAAAGDETAVEVALAGSYDRLRGVIRARIPARLRSLIDAEDVVQETHIAVFQGLGALRGRAPEAFERWVLAIALNRLRSRIRELRAAKRGGRAWRITPESDESAMKLWQMVTHRGDGPSTTARRDEALEALGTAIEALPDYQGEAIRLVYLQGRSAREAATALSRTERAVHGLCRRGLETLRARLACA